MKLEEGLDGLKDPFLCSHIWLSRTISTLYNCRVADSSSTSYSESAHPLIRRISSCLTIYLGEEKQQHKHIKEELIYVRIILSHWTAEFIIKKDWIRASLGQLESVFLFLRFLLKAEQKGLAESQKHFITCCLQQKHESVPKFNVNLFGHYWD